jgi:hypothetical protein
VNAVFRRFYLLRWKAAALLCLPGVLLAAWYAFGAFARFDMYRRAENAQVPFTLELFHLELFDLLRQDLRHVWLAPAPVPSRIERFTFRIGRAEWEDLKASRGQEEREYSMADLVVDGGRRLPVEVRLLGQKPWHVLYKQMSLKVQLPRGELLDGYRVFTLGNDPTPMVVGEQIMLDLLRERGVLVPRSDFARVVINGTDLGVFRYETQPDESLLRLAHRQPGSMYSGDLPGSAKSEELWDGTERWRKVAWREEPEKEDMSELSRLLSAVKSASIEEFAQLAEHEIDLDAFAWFEAIDIAFGCDQHNYRENHKLYFDPYKGRWEPIAWGFRGFEHDPELNRVENPLLLRLKLVPGYLAKRNQALYELLTTDGSGSAVRARGLALLERIGPELLTDPYWDAYRMLPRVSDFHRQMVRPMNMNRALLVFESELETYERRRAYLIEQLRKNPLWLEQGERAGDATAVSVLVNGEAGAKLEGFRVRWPAAAGEGAQSCSDSGWSVESEDGRVRAEVPAVAMDGARPGAEDVDLVRFEHPIELFAATRVEAREEVDPEHGAVRTRPAPMAYRFVLRSSCAPEAIEAVGFNLATGSRIHSRPATEAILADRPAKQLAARDVPSFAAGEGSAHPWQLPLERPETITLGPGAIDVTETRMFETHQSVRVAPGTALTMAAGASLIFLGPVAFEGTAQAPITIEPAAQHASWGGMIIQGEATRGSSLAYVTARGGSTPLLRQARYPGMINLHDTGRIELRHVVLSDNFGSDDMVHASYVEGLVVEDSRIERAAADGWDIELSSAVLRRIEVLDAGDDAIDLMGARVEVEGSVLAGLRGNGISAGEQSDVSVQDTLIADALVGALAKNASEIDLDGSLLYRTTTGVRIYTRTVRYEGDSKVSADVLFVVDSKRAVQREDGSSLGLDLGRAQLGWPRHDALDHLRDNVLQLETWEGLGGWLARRHKSGAGTAALAP